MRWLPSLAASSLTGLLALMLVAGLGSARATDALEEPATGVEFALECASTVTGDTLSLTGVGVRKKLFFKVYAFGLYVDMDALAPQLSAWQGKDEDALRADPALYESLVAAPVERLAVMRFVRKVGADSMRDALSDALGRGVPEDDPAREAFLGLWDQVIAKGDEVTIAFGADGVVTVIRGETKRGEVSSQALAEALLRSWLGEDPVSDDIRDGVVARIPALLSGR